MIKHHTSTHHILIILQLSTTTMYYTTTHHHIQLLIIVISNSCHPEMGRLASVALAVSLLLVIQSHLGSSQRDGFFSFLTSFRRPARVRKPQPIIVRASRVHKVGDKVLWFIWFLTRINVFQGVDKVIGVSNPNRLRTATRPTFAPAFINNNDDLQPQPSLTNNVTQFANQVEPFKCWLYVHIATFKDILF